jgi:hypothetical protein
LAGSPPCRSGNPSLSLQGCNTTPMEIWIKTKYNNKWENMRKTPLPVFLSHVNKSMSTSLLHPGFPICQKYKSFFLSLKGMRGAITAA